jgi:hypothetical protein
MWFRIGTGDGHHEHSDESSGYMKSRKFIE